MKRLLLAVLLTLALAPSARASAVLEGTEHFTTDTPPVSAYPTTLSIWMKVNNETADQTGIFIGDKDASNQFIATRLAGTIAGDPPQVCTRAGGSTNCGGSTGFDFTTATWYHLCGVFTDETSATMYINGGNSAANNPETFPTGVDRLAVGRATTSSPTWQTDGKVAHAAVWDSALSEANCQALAAGDNPLTVDSGNLIAYWPLLTDATDSVGSNDLTAQGTITFDTEDNPTVDAPPGVLKTRVIVTQ